MSYDRFSSGAASILCFISDSHILVLFYCYLWLINDLFYLKGGVTYLYWFSEADKHKNIITSCNISSILYENIFAISLLFPLEKRAWSFSRANLNSFYPRIISPLYFWNGQVVLEQIIHVVQSWQNIFAITSHWKGRVASFNQSWIPSPRDVSC